MCRHRFKLMLVFSLLAFVAPVRGETIAHWQFDGVPGEAIETDIDVVGGYVATKFYDATYGGNAATDVFYGPANPTYNDTGTSAELRNDPGGNDPGVGIYVPDEGANTTLDLSTLGAYTIEAFIQPATVRQSVVIRKYGGAGRWYIDLSPSGELRFNINSDAAANRANAGPDAAVEGEWCHVAAIFDETDAEAPMRIYVDGELKGTSTYGDRVADTTNALGIGCIVRDNGNPPGNSGQFFDGRIDEVRITSGALAVDEFLLFAVTGAGRPSPTDGATDVPPDTVLSWIGSRSAESHDVYLGTVLEDVENASRTNPLGVLVGQEQTADVYEPENLLEIGQTYYWRVDTELAADDGAGTTSVKGDVWSFTVEPYSYPVQEVAATASSAQGENTSEQKTVDGSGLNEDDEHSTNANDMWLSDPAGPEPTWIEYEFPQTLKLDEMWVWNQNQVVEGSVGFGAKDVTIEYSSDGALWTTLGEFEFARAPGSDEYTPMAPVDFAGATARFVRLTINSNWGGVVSQYGLSEVRFFYIPTRAREPEPVSGATGVAPQTVLNWRSGRGAVQHDVHLSSNEVAVADGTALAGTVEDNRFEPALLELGTTYFWKVNEVNEAADPSVWESEIWTFATQEFLSVEDFESYTDNIEAGEAIYQVWIDGVENGTGSFVGYEESSDGTFGERKIVHSGRQSMPLSYDNTGAASISETTRTFTSPRDWTAYGADTLQLHFHGNPVAFLEREDGTIIMSAAGADIGDLADEFRFAYKPLNGNGSIVARVDSLTDTNASAKAGVMIRETLDLGSTFAGVFVTPGTGLHFQARSSTNTTAADDAAVATAEQQAAKAPIWVKLERNGDSLTGFYSADGQTWVPMAWNPQTIGMRSDVYVGLAVTSHNVNAATTATFSEVTFTAGASGQWQQEAIGFEQVTNDPAPLYVTLEDAAGNTGTAIHPDEAALGLDSWIAWQIPLGDFVSAGVDVTSIQAITIGVGDPDDAGSSGSGLLYVDDIEFGKGPEEAVSTIAHWTFDGVPGEPIVTDPDVAGGYVAHKFFDATFGSNAAVDVTYGPANPMYNESGTSADLVNDPAGNDPGAAIVVPDEGVDTPLDMSTFGAFTIEAFIYPYTLRQSVVVRKYGGGPGQYYIDMTAGGNLRFSINSDGNNAAAGDGAVAAEEWSHVAAVFDETDLAAPMRIYVNGELKGTAGFRDRPGDSPRGLGIGAIIRDNNNPPGNSGQFFNGRIDEVRFSAGALAVEDFLLNVTGQ